MARKKAETRERGRRRRRQPVWLKMCQIGVLALAGLAAFSIGCKIVRPFHLWFDESRETRRMEVRLAELRRSNDELRIKRAYLSSPQGAENEARRLGYVSPGEVTVFVTPPKPKPARK